MSVSISVRVTGIFPANQINKELPNGPSACYSDEAVPVLWTV